MGNRVSWENNILGFIPKTDWLDIGFNPQRQNDPIDTLFGDDKTDNLVAEYETIAAQYQIPVMAQFHSFDSEAQTTFRIPVDTHNIEKGLIKQKINQSERLRALTRAGVQNDQMYDYVIRDGARLAEAVITRTKVMKNELMATGQATISENNLNLTIDYGVAEDQKGYTIVINDNEDVPAQIQTIIDDALNKGVIINGILTSKKVLAKLRGTKSIQAAINGNISIGSTVRVAELEGYLSEEFGIESIITNDLVYGADWAVGDDGRPVVDSKRYYPDNKITFFATNPGGKMGTGLWGAPPEVDAARFMDVATEGSVSPYIYVSQWMETDPAVLWTKASTLFIPVLYNPNALYIATVSEAEG